MASNPEVESWLAAKPPEIRAAWSRAREIILASDDRIDESIKWKTPTFSYKGNIISFHVGAKRLVSLMFHRGAEIPGTFPRLEGDGDVARTMRLPDLEAVEAAADELTAVVQAWCAWRDA